MPIPKLYRKYAWKFWSRIPRVNINEGNVSALWISEKFIFTEGRKYEVKRKEDRTLFSLEELKRDWLPQAVDKFLTDFFSPVIYNCNKIYYVSISAVTDPNRNTVITIVRSIDDSEAAKEIASMSVTSLIISEGWERSGCFIRAGLRPPFGHRFRPFHG